GVPDQPLQRDAADLGVLAPVLVEQAHLQLVPDVGDADRAAGVGDGSAPLGEAPDGSAQGDGVAVDLDRDLVAVGQSRVVHELGSHARFYVAVRFHALPWPRVPRWARPPGGAAIRGAYSYFAPRASSMVSWMAAAAGIASSAPSSPSSAPPTSTATIVASA